MGSVSDRSNPRWFMPLGLLLSAAVTASFGLFKGIYASLTLIIVLQALNGWFNGMGWPPCGKTMVHWFSANERGRVVSLWNMAHNVGGGLVAGARRRGRLAVRRLGREVLFQCAGRGVDRRRRVSCCCAIRRRPADCRRSRCTATTCRRITPRKPRRTLSFREIFFANVLNNRLLWAIAVANAFVYFVRYGVQNWIPTYLETAKGFSFQQSSTAWFMFEYAGDSRHDPVRLDVRPGLSRPPRPGDDCCSWR